MDDFLNQLREAPRPEYAEALRQRLAETDRRMQRRTARAKLLAAVGTACAAFGLVFALHEPMGLRPVAETESNQSQAVSALLLPVIEPQAPSASGRWAETTVTLHAPPTPISHHHSLVNN